MLKFVFGARLILSSSFVSDAGGGVYDGLVILPVVIKFLPAND